MTFVTLVTIIARVTCLAVILVHNYLISKTTNLKHCKDLCEPEFEVRTVGDFYRFVCHFVYRFLPDGNSLLAVNRLDQSAFSGPNGPAIDSQTFTADNFHLWLQTTFDDVCLPLIIVSNCILLSTTVSCMTKTFRPKHIEHDTWYIHQY